MFHGARKDLVTIDRRNPDPHAIVELVNYYKCMYGIDLFAFSEQLSHSELMETRKDEAIVAAHMQIGYNTLAVDKKELGIPDNYKVIKYSDPKKMVECVVLEFDDATSRLAICQWAKIMLGKGYRILYEQVMSRIAWYEKIDQDKIDRMTKRLVHGD